MVVYGHLIYIYSAHFVFHMILFFCVAFVFLFEVFCGILLTNFIVTKKQLAALLWFSFWVICCFS